MFAEETDAMAFRIHEDQENASLGLRKDNADIFLANQRRALGDLSQFACNQNRNGKLVSIQEVVSRTLYFYSIYTLLCISAGFDWVVQTGREQSGKTD